MKLRVGVVLLVFLTVSCSNPVYKSKLEKEAAGLLDNVENSSMDLQHVLIEMDKINNFNTIRRNNMTLATVESSITALEKAEKETRVYLAYVQKNSNRFEEENLFFYMAVGELLGPELSEIRAVVKRYLKSLKRWLEYSCEYSDAIVGRDYVRVSSYEHLFTEYIYAQKRYKSVNMKYRDFVNAFALNNPALTRKFSARYKRIKKEMGW